MARKAPATVSSPSFAEPRFGHPMRARHYLGGPPKIGETLRYATRALGYGAHFVFGRDAAGRS